MPVSRRWRVVISWLCGVDIGYYPLNEIVRAIHTTLIVACQMRCTSSIPSQPPIAKTASGTVQEQTLINPQFPFLAF